MTLLGSNVVSARPCRIVVAGDDTAIRRALKDGLHTAFGAADISFAENGHDALENLDLRNIDLLITDHEMPLVGGSQLAAAMAYLSPDAQIIVFSGDNDLESQGMFPAHTRFVAKSGTGGLRALLSLARDLLTRMPVANASSFGRLNRPGFAENRAVESLPAQVRVNCSSPSTRSGRGRPHTLPVAHIRSR